MDLIKSPDTTLGAKENGISKTEEHNTRSSTSNRFRGCCAAGGFCRQNLLTILTLFAVVAGIAIGLIAHNARTFTKREAMYVMFPGELFLRMLKCLILPLIASSLISALGSLDTKLSGKIGARAVLYYLATTILAIILGIILVIAIRPGSGGSSRPDNDNLPKSKPSLTEDTLLDLIRNIFPPNLVEAGLFQTKTQLVSPPEPGNATAEELRLWNFNISKTDGTNFLGIVAFSCVFGIVLGQMGREGEKLLTLFTCLSNTMMTITKYVIWFSPIGVMFLVLGNILGTEDFSVVAGQVGMYTVTVLAGLFIHALITLPLIYLIIVRKSPLKFIGNMSHAIATAFGTSSSSATLPITLACIEDKNGIDPRIARFCLPIGATINMDGTALYEAVAAIFIAQVREVPLSIGSIIAISIAATAASIGAAGIPQAGLVTMVIVLNVVGLPAEDVYLVFVVDWFLDRFRTAINVLGDAIGAGIVAHLCQNDLDAIPSTTNSNNNAARIEMTPL